MSENIKNEEYNPDIITLTDDSGKEYTFEVLDAIETNAVFDMSYLVGMAVAFVVGIASIKLVKWLVKSDRFGKFAYYCFAAAAFAVGVGIFEMLH